MWIPMEARTIKSPGTGVTGNYESPHTGTGSQTQVLWKKTSCILNLRTISPTPSFVF